MLETQHSRDSSTGTSPRPVLALALVVSLSLCLSLALFASLVLGAAPARAGSDGDTIADRVEALEDQDVREAQRVLRLRLAAMRARIDALEAGLQAQPPQAREHILLSRGVGMPSASADSHPQEVLEIVAAATGDSSDQGAGRRVSERLRHKNRASPAATVGVLRGRVAGLERDNAKRLRNRKKGRQAMARMEVRADNLEDAIGIFEENLRSVRKKPGRTTYSDIR